MNGRGAYNSLNFDTRMLSVHKHFYEQLRNRKRRRGFAVTPKRYQKRCNPAHRENKKPVIHWCSRIQHVQNVVRQFGSLDIVGIWHLGDRRCQGPSRSPRSTESCLEQHRAGWTLLQENTVSETRKFDNENDGCFSALNRNDANMQRTRRDV